MYRYTVFDRASQSFRQFCSFWYWLLQHIHTSFFRHKLLLTVCRVWAYRYFQLGTQMLNTKLLFNGSELLPVTVVLFPFSVFRSRTSNCWVQKLWRAWTPRSTNCRTRIRGSLLRLRIPVPVLAEPSAWSVRWALSKSWHTPDYGLVHMDCIWMFFWIFIYFF